MENGSSLISRKIKGRIDDLDRLSALPEPILHHIMSFLPNTQLVQTNVLSKTWLHAWYAFPVLEISERRFPHLCQIEQMMKARFYWEKILQIRHRDSVGINKLTFKVNGFELDSVFRLSNRCILYAIENNVKELILKILTYVRHDLPPIVLCSHLLTVLRLQGCKLDLPENGVSLPSLRKLSLSNVFANDQVMDNLFAQSPLVENLKFDGCVGFNSLDIKALNARSISIASLPATCKVDVTFCKNLKHLHLYQCCFTDEWLSSQILRLPLLESLSIVSLSKIQRIYIMSSSLRCLKIWGCHNSVEVKLSAPNIKAFTYLGDLISFSIGTLTFSEANLHFDPKNVDFDWYVKLIDLLGKLHKVSKVLNFGSYGFETVHVPGELRLIRPQPLSGVKHLNFALNFSCYIFSVAKVMDFLLWTSPHAETVCLDYPSIKTLNFKFSYKQQPVYEGDTAQCCKFLPISCWEHCVKEVDVEIITTYVKMNMLTLESQSSFKVERFVLEGENILEKIDGLAVSGVFNIERVY